MGFNQFCKEENDMAKKQKNNIKDNLDEQKNQKEELQNMYDKYKTYSNEDLMQELLNKTNEQKNKGEFDYEKLRSSIDSLSPFLTSEQQNTIKGIMEKLK